MCYYEGESTLLNWTICSGIHPVLSTRHIYIRRSRSVADAFTEENLNALSEEARRLLEEKMFLKKPPERINWQKEGF